MITTRLAILLLCFQVLSEAVFGQCYFFKLYDNVGLNDFGYCITETSDGKLLIGSNTFIQNARDATWVLKLDECGESIWTKQYILAPLTGAEHARRVVENSNGSFTFWGDQRDTTEGASSSFLLTVSSNGDSLNHVIVNAGYNDRGTGIIAQNDGGFIGTGFYNVTSQDSTAFTVKTDSFGAVKWVQTYGDSTVYFRTRNINKTIDSGYILSGWAQTIGAPLVTGDLFLLKTDSVGNKQWLRTYGSPNYLEYQGYGIALTEGGYLIAGNREIIPDVYYRGYAVKTDNAGNVEWEKFYSDSLITVTFTNAVQLRDNNYLLVGILSDTMGNNYDAKAYYLKIDKYGNKIWERKYTYYGGITHNYINDVKELVNGDIVSTGYMIPVGTTLTTRNDLLALKTDSCGYTVGDTTAAQFSANVISNQVTVTLQSNTVCRAVWHWGTGYTTDSRNPEPYSYSDTGTFTIMLITYAGNTIDTAYQTITINTVGIESISYNDNHISIYPNPATQTIMIQTDNIQSSIKGVMMFDVTGKSVLSARCSERCVADVIGLPNGLYFLHIEMSNGQRVVRKVVKE